MLNNVITTTDQVTVEWLTAVLAADGALTHGAVASFELGAGHGNWSANAKLTIVYTDQAQGSLPQRLFLKIVNCANSSADESFGGSEVAYYNRDYLDVKDAPLLRCYHAVYSERIQQYHILLDDISETHTVAAEKKPTLAYGLALADGLAVLHARWWGGRRLAEMGAEIHRAKHIKRFVDIAKPGMGHILTQIPDELEPHWPDLIQSLFANHPQAIIERTKNDNGFTLIHGDVGHHNVIVPRVGELPIYIIDRQPFNWSLTAWLGAYDLAYAMVLDWDVETRREYEILVLKQYHAHLIKNGVISYSWERLYDDYRLCVAMCVYVSTEYCRGGINKRWFHVWLRMLQKSLTACDDLDCSSLW